MKLFNRLKSLTVTLGTLVGFTIVVGCGGDSDAPLSGLYGIYELTDWTENEATCDADGASVLDENSYASRSAAKRDFLVDRWNEF